MIIGTAGHIDHGKSTLIEALTGRTMDPLAEERRRGITLDLHFAPLELEPGTTAGVVDVPGHEDLVRTMVAGAAGLDLVLLVVAADEGIMPQTREHLAVVQQLGIPAGIPVITKADLVEREWAEMVALEVADWLAGTTIRFGSPVIVSGTTGEGLAQLREAIRAAAALVPPRPADDLFRMPIDRAISVAGVGTVVTGTTWSGSLNRSDTVRILPSGKVGRVRTIQSHGADLEQSAPATRTAVGIAGLERDDLRRGHVLVRENDPWIVTTALDTVLDLLPSAPRSLAHRHRVRVHLGAAEVLARLQLAAPLEPGGKAAARLTLEAPLAARGGDRFVLRNYSPVHTIGGGWVTDPDPPRRASRADPDLGSSDPVLRARALVSRRPAGLEIRYLPALLGISPDAAARLKVMGTTRLPSGWMVLDESLTLAERRLQEVVAAHQVQHSAAAGISRETLRQSVRLPLVLVDEALERLERTGRLTGAGGLIRTAGFEPKVEGGQALIDQVVGLVRAGGLTPPDLAELETTVGRRGIADALRLAARAGTVSAVEAERYYSAEALARFRAALSELGASGAAITPAGLRERLGLSRKFLIPLLEWADRERLTVRSGDARRLVGPAAR